MTQSTWPSGQPLPEIPARAWPAADRRALRPAAGQRSGPFANKHAARHGDAGPATWGTATRRNVEKAYGKWIGFLDVIAPEVLAEPPWDRITESRCQAFVDALAASGLAVSSRAFHLYHLVMAARVLDPGRDWAWLADAASRLREAASPVRDKRSRTVPAGELYALGTSLMDAAARQDGDRAAALDHRDGLVLALWAARPWRLRTFAALDLERHLRVHGNTAASVVFDGDDMKTPTAREWPLPDHLVPYLRAYIERHRSRLPGADEHTGFWPSMKGDRLSENALARVLGRRTETAFGVAMHPHAVRYAAATSAALSGPQSAGTVMAILGHADPRTSSDAYVTARTLDAQRRAAAALERTKADLGSKTP